MAREYDDQWCEAMSLMLLGHQRLADGEPDRARSELTEAAALFQATGNMVYLAWCLEGLAGVAAAEGGLGRAAEIAGGRDALRAQTGVLLPPVYPAAWERMLEHGAGRPRRGGGSRRPGRGWRTSRRRRSSPRFSAREAEGETHEYPAAQAAGHRLRPAAVRADRETVDPG